MTTSESERYRRSVPHLIAIEGAHAREGFPAFFASWGREDWMKVRRRLKELGHAIP